MYLIFAYLCENTVIAVTAALLVKLLCIYEGRTMEGHRLWRRSSKTCRGALGFLSVIPIASILILSCEMIVISCGLTRLLLNLSVEGCL